RSMMNRGREEECLQTLAKLCRASPDDLLVWVEFLEVKALRLFEVETAARKYPQWQDGSSKSRFLIRFHDYLSLITNRSLFKQTIVACLVMTFQQWNGINTINYYAPFIFNTTSLLATGVVGILEFLFTIPAVLWVDKVGQKKILLAGAISMAACHFIVAGISRVYHGNWDQHRAAGWVAVAFVWICSANFGYSWGPVAWILISEIYPLSMRAKGVSIRGSSNWLNNFTVSISTSPFLSASDFSAFIFFGCITTIGALYVYFLVPETKGRTLEEMDKLFGATGMAAEDAKLKERIKREIGLLALLGEETPDQGSEDDDEKAT
ncbi:hypothetical protein M432DRAFT_528992, partial [Thermoascus aurantiacus ATCC 26904]